MWPISCSTAIRKIRHYKKIYIKSYPSNTTDLADNSLLPLQPTTYFQCEIKGEEWEKRVPDLVSSSLSRMRFTK
jgi:hypothetical protein